MTSNEQNGREVPAAPDHDAAPDHEAASDYGVPVSWSRSQRVLHPTRQNYLEVAGGLRQDGFDFLADLCATDYLTHSGRSLPEAVAQERFEVVVNLLSMAPARRVRLRVQVPESDPRIPTLFWLFPGVEALEREAFDMFGVHFDGHPDLTRILLPEDWEGYPLRKDYSAGRVPVQFKATPQPR